MKKIETVTVEDFLNKLKIAINGEIKLADGYTYKVTERGIEVNGFVESVLEDKGYFLSNLILLMLQETSREYQCVTTLELFDKLELSFGTPFGSFNPKFDGVYKKLRNENSKKVFSRLKKFLAWFRGFIYTLFMRGSVHLLQLSNYDTYVFNKETSSVEHKCFKVVKGEMRWVSE